MNRIIIAAALAATFAAQAAEPIVFDSDGGYWQRQGTARSYTNKQGAAQADMLWERNDKNSAMKGPLRQRIGVVGCADGRGIIAFVDTKGTPEVEPHAWTSSGTSVLDGLAIHTCTASR